MRKITLLTFVFLICSVLSLQTAFSARTGSLAIVPQGGLLYFVASTGDGGLVGSSNFCDDGTGKCTLRAAIQAANLHPGDDGIQFNIPTTDPGYNSAAGSWTINLTRALPDLSTSVGIVGPGADKLTVRRNTGGDYRIFNVTVPATGVVTFSGMTINNGLTPDANGGGIAIFFASDGGNVGTVNVTNCTLSNNSAGEGGGFDFGGGIYNVSGKLNVINSTLSGNSGGAIRNVDGTVNITNSMIRNNSSRTAGGIYNRNGTVNVSNSTLTENSAGGSDNGDCQRIHGTGGGILNFDGTVNVTNSTLSNNFAQNGGAISNRGTGTVNVTNSTIAGNFAFGFGDIGHAGGIASVAGAVNVTSSLIAGNTASSSPDVEGVFNSFGFNLIGKKDGSAGFATTTDQTGTIASPLDPKLDPSGLQDNGGPTQTIALMAKSPAIDKGRGGTFVNDQRGQGFVRTFDRPGIPNAIGGDGADIGAFEKQPRPSP